MIYTSVNNYALEIFLDTRHSNLVDLKTGTLVMTVTIEDITCCIFPSASPKHILIGTRFHLMRTDQTSEIYEQNRIKLLKCLQGACMMQQRLGH